MRINAMIYGPSGVGKTHFLGTTLTVPDLLPVLFISLDQSHTTLLTSWYATNVLKLPKGESHIYRDDDGKVQFKAEYGKLVVPDDMSQLNAFATALATDPDLRSKYKTVVVDNLSAFYVSEMVDQLGKPGKDRSDPAIPGRLDYQTLQWPIISLIYSLTSKTDANLIVSAARRTIDVEVNGRVMQKEAPALFRSLNEAVPAWFDIIGLMQLVGVGQRQMLFNQSAAVEAVKDRWHAFDDVRGVWQNPNVPTLYERMKAISL